MSEPNIRDLQDKLTDAFVNYQWRLENPMPPPGETQEMRIHKYLCDSMFHAKVDVLVAGVLDMVQTWLREQNDI